MSVAAKIDPGPGLRLVVAHLRDVRASATADIRDPQVQLFMTKTLDAWIGQAEDDRASIEAAHSSGLDVTKVFRVALPTPAAMGIDPKVHANTTTRLREHGWLSAPHGSPATYRAQRGDVLMFAPNHRGAR